MEDHGEMPIEDFTHGLFRNIMIIRWLLTVILIVELADWVMG